MYFSVKDACFFDVFDLVFACSVIVVSPCCGRSFVLCVQRLDPSTETFVFVQCAIPGRGGELIGVCSVCVHCLGWSKEQ